MALPPPLLRDAAAELIASSRNPALAAEAVLQKYEKAGYKGWNWYPQIPNLMFAIKTDQEQLNEAPLAGLFWVANFLPEQILEFNAANNDFARKVLFSRSVPFFKDAVQVCASMTAAFYETLAKSYHNDFHIPYCKCMIQSFRMLALIVQLTNYPDLLQDRAVILPPLVRSVRLLMEFMFHRGSEGLIESAHLSDIATAAMSTNDFSDTPLSWGTSVDEVLEYIRSDDEQARLRVQIGVLRSICRHTWNVSRDPLSIFPYEQARELVSYNVNLIVWTAETTRAMVPTILVEDFVTVLLESCSSDEIEHTHAKCFTVYLRQRDTSTAEGTDALLKQIAVQLDRFLRYANPAVLENFSRRIDSTMTRRCSKLFAQILLECGHMEPDVDSVGGSNGFLAACARIMKCIHNCTDEIPQTLVSSTLFALVDADTLGISCKYTRLLALCTIFLQNLPVGAGKGHLESSIEKVLKQNFRALADVPTAAVGTTQLQPGGCLAGLLLRWQAAGRDLINFLRRVFNPLVREFVNNYKIGNILRLVGAAHLTTTNPHVMPWNVAVAEQVVYEYCRRVQTAGLHSYAIDECSSFCAVCTTEPFYQCRNELSQLYNAYVEKLRNGTPEAVCRMSDVNVFGHAVFTSLIGAFQLDDGVELKMKANQLVAEATELLATLKQCRVFLRLLDECGLLAMFPNGPDVLALDCDVTTMLDWRKVISECYAGSPLDQKNELIIKAGNLSEIQLFRRLFSRASKSVTKETFCDSLEAALHLVNELQAPKTINSLKAELQMNVFVGTSDDTHAGAIELFELSFDIEKMAGVGGRHTGRNDAAVTQLLRLSVSYQVLCEALCAASNDLKTNRTLTTMCRNKPFAELEEILVKALEAPCGDAEQLVEDLQNKLFHANTLNSIATAMFALAILVRSGGSLTGYFEEQYILKPDVHVWLVNYVAENASLDSLAKIWVDAVIQIDSVFGRLFSSLGDEPTTIDPSKLLGLLRHISSNVERNGGLRELNALLRTTVGDWGAFKTWLDPSYAVDEVLKISSNLKECLTDAVFTFCGTESEYAVGFRKEKTTLTPQQLLQLYRIARTIAAKPFTDSKSELRNAAREFIASLEAAESIFALRRELYGLGDTSNTISEDVPAALEHTQRLQTVVSQRLQQMQLELRDKDAELLLCVPPAVLRQISWLITSQSSKTDKRLLRSLVGLAITGLANRGIPMPLLMKQHGDLVSQADGVIFSTSSAAEIHPFRVIATFLRGCEAVLTDRIGRVEVTSSISDQPQQLRILLDPSKDVVYSAALQACGETLPLPNQIIWDDTFGGDVHALKELLNVALHTKCHRIVTADVSTLSGSLHEELSQFAGTHLDKSMVTVSASSSADVSAAEALGNALHAHSQSWIQQPENKLLLVEGTTGSGKSHYIRQRVTARFGKGTSIHTIFFEVNDSFTVAKLIERYLLTADDNSPVCIHLHITKYGELPAFRVFLHDLLSYGLLTDGKAGHCVAVNFARQHFIALEVLENDMLTETISTLSFIGPALVYSEYIRLTAAIVNDYVPFAPEEHHSRAPAFIHSVFEAMRNVYHDVSDAESVNAKFFTLCRKFKIPCNRISQTQFLRSIVDAATLHTQMLEHCDAFRSHQLFSPLLYLSEPLGVIRDDARGADTAYRNSIALQDPRGPIPHFFSKIMALKLLSAAWIIRGSPSDEARYWLVETPDNFEHFRVISTLPMPTRPSLDGEEPPWGIPYVSVSTPDECQPALAWALGLDGPRTLQQVLQQHRAILTPHLITGLLDTHSRSHTAPGYIYEGGTGQGKTFQEHIYSEIRNIAADVFVSIPSHLMLLLRYTCLKQNITLAEADVLCALNLLLENDETNVLILCVAICEYMTTLLSRYPLMLLHPDCISFHERIRRLPASLRRQGRSHAYSAVLHDVSEQLRRHITELRMHPMASLKPEEDLTAAEDVLQTHVADSGSAEVTANDLRDYIDKLLTVKKPGLFHRITAHKDITADVLRALVTGIVQQYSAVMDVRMMIKVFIDELNTIGCPGMAAELFSHHTLDGVAIDKRIVFVGAINPAGTCDADVATAIDYMHVVPTSSRANVSEFIVDALPSSLLPRAVKLPSMSCGSKDIFVVDKLRNALRAQVHTLPELELSDGLKSISQCILAAHEHVARAKILRVHVSVRNLQRAAELCIWLYMQRTNFGGENPFLPSAARDILSEMQYLKICALVAVAVEYMTKLADNTDLSKEAAQQRGCFAEALAPLTDALQSTTSLGRLDQIFDLATTNLWDQLSAYLPGLSPNVSLRETCFCLLVGINVPTPLLIVGAPGTGKTEAFRSVCSLLEKSKRDGILSKMKKVIVRSYACSEYSTPGEILSFVERALKDQKMYNTTGEQVRIVCFLDEAGLPNAKLNALKSLHDVLEQHGEDDCVAIVLISNEVLDAAKTNRCLLLWQPRSSSEDAVNLHAKVFCRAGATDMAAAKAFTEKFLVASDAIRSSKQLIEWDWFGVRDTMFCCRALGACGTISSENFLHALRANVATWNPSEFSSIAEIFYKECAIPLDGPVKALPVETVLRILNAPPENLAFPLQRHLLLVDSSKSCNLRDVIAAFPKLFKIRAAENGIRELFLSNSSRQGFAHDEAVSAFKDATSNGKLLIVVNAAGVLSAVMDLINMLFSEVTTNRTTEYYATVSFGSRPYKWRVHPQFRAVFIMSREQVRHTPWPILSRLSKICLSLRDVVEECASGRLTEWQHSPSNITAGFLNSLNENLNAQAMLSNDTGALTGTTTVFSHLFQRLTEAIPSVTQVSEEIFQEIYGFIRPENITNLTDSSALRAVRTMVAAEPFEGWLLLKRLFGSTRQKYVIYTRSTGDLLSRLADPAKIAAALDQRCVSINTHRDIEIARELGASRCVQLVRLSSFDAIDRIADLIVAAMGSQTDACNLLIAVNAAQAEVCNPITVTYLRSVIDKRLAELHGTTLEANTPNVIFLLYADQTNILTGKLMEPCLGWSSRFVDSFIHLNRDTRDVVIPSVVSCVLGELERTPFDVPPLTVDEHFVSERIKKVTEVKDGETISSLCKAIVDKLNWCWRTQLRVRLQEARQRLVAGHGSSLLDEASSLLQFIQSTYFDNLLNGLFSCTDHVSDIASGDDAVRSIAIYLIEGAPFSMHPLNSVSLPFEASTPFFARIMAHLAEYLQLHARGAANPAPDSQRVLKFVETHWNSLLSTNDRYYELWIRDLVCGFLYRGVAAEDALNYVKAVLQYNSNFSMHSKAKAIALLLSSSSSLVDAVENAIGVVLPLTVGQQPVTDGVSLVDRTLMELARGLELKETVSISNTFAATRFASFLRIARTVSLPELSATPSRLLQLMLLADPSTPDHMHYLVGLLKHLFGLSAAAEDVGSEDSDTPVFLRWLLDHFPWEKTVDVCRLIFQHVAGNVAKLAALRLTMAGSYSSDTASAAAVVDSPTSALESLCTWILRCEHPCVWESVQLLQHLVNVESLLGKGTWHCRAVNATLRELDPKTSLVGSCYVGLPRVIYVDPWLCQGNEAVSSRAKQFYFDNDAAKRCASLYFHAMMASLMHVPFETLSALAIETTSLKAMEDEDLAFAIQRSAVYCAYLAAAARAPIQSSDTRFPPAVVAICWTHPHMWLRFFAMMNSQCTPPYISPSLLKDVVGESAAAIALFDEPAEGVFDGDAVSEASLVPIPAYYESVVVGGVKSLCSIVQSMPVDSSRGMPLMRARTAACQTLHPYQITSLRINNSTGPCIACCFTDHGDYLRRTLVDLLDVLPNAVVATSTIAYWQPAYEVVRRGFKEIQSRDSDVSVEAAVSNLPAGSRAVVEYALSCIQPVRRRLGVEAQRVGDFGDGGYFTALIAVVEWMKSWSEFATELPAVLDHSLIETVKGHTTNDMTPTILHNLRRSLHFLIRACGDEAVSADVIRQFVQTALSDLQ